MLHSIHFILAILSIAVLSVLLVYIVQIVQIVMAFLRNRNRQLLQFSALIAVILAVFFAVFTVQKLILFYMSFLQQLFTKVIENALGAGLFCGFLTIATISWIFYMIIVPRLYFDNFEDSFFFEHHQKRVAAIISFVAGQFSRFAYFYNRPLYEVLFQTKWVLLLFLTFFGFQLLWTHQTIVRNWRFLYPNDKRKRVVKRVLLLQLEFIINFIFQLAPSDSLIEKPDSMVSRLVSRYLEDRGQTIFFVTSGFVGWLIGILFFLLFYTKIFGLIAPWAQSYFRSFQGGSNTPSYDDYFDDDEDDRGFNPFKPPKPKK